jgi:AcrR family transcriptional regulator
MKVNHKTKPGPVPFEKSATNKLRVSLAVAAGLKLPTIAKYLGISRASLCRLFPEEIAIGRTKRMLDMLQALYEAAMAGNVAAAKALLARFTDAPEAKPRDTRWDQLASEYGVDLAADDDEDNSRRKMDFQ